MKKKLISILVATTMVASLSACGSASNAGAQAGDDVGNAIGDQGNGEQITLKVWGAQTDQDLLKELCEEFASEHTEKSWSFDYGVVGEADARFGCSFLRT